MIKILLISALVLGGLGGCGEEDGVGAEGDCASALEGRSFKGPFGECGLCSCGETAGCNWQVAFAGGQLQWTLSDYSIHASYVCMDGEIRDADTQELLATYDAEQDAVTLDGAAYAACDGECVIEWTTCDEVCPGACGQLSGSEYRSIDRLECGLCPGGAADCHWVIAFSGGDFQWHYSDVVQSGSYTCVDETTLVGTTFGDTLEGSLGDDGVLTWDGIRYERCEGTCDPEPGACE